MARASARVIFVCRVVLGETRSVVWRERGTFGKNPFRHFALRNASSPFCRLAATSSPGRGKSFHSGGGLGKEGRSRPHPSTAGRSLPLSCKLFASAKASPFRERWHGEAVTERVDFRNELLPSFRFAKCQLPRGKLSSSSVNGQKEPAPIPSLDKPALSCYDGIISNSRRFEQLACKTNGGKAR